MGWDGAVEFSRKRSRTRPISFSLVALFVSVLKETKGSHRYRMKSTTNSYYVPSPIYCVQVDMHMELCMYVRM